MSDSTRSPHYVYSLHSSDGRCLYVGMSSNPGRRLREHQKAKPWWSEVADITIRRVGGEDPRATAEFLEMVWITERRPVHNVALNGGGQERHLAPECVMGEEYYYLLRDGRVLNGMLLWVEYDRDQNVLYRIDDPARFLIGSELDRVVSMESNEAQRATVYE